ncbi:LysE family translocator [Enterobacter ludwigii]|uniref:LysE family translocator n=1 Tax=Enterobacter ludwigii TaxID=299767 RepID=UPI003976145E
MNGEQVRPDMAYVIGQSVANGRRAGILSATGVALGSCTHAVASAIGLTALITASPLMFTIIKYAGATYLVYLGVRMLVDTLRVKNENSETSMHNKAKSKPASLLSKGFITTITNPKVLLFFISFFPQFVSPNGEHHASSFLLLGLVYALIAFLTDLTFALLAGGASGLVSENRKLQKALDRIVGGTFVALGIRLALTHR